MITYEYECTNCGHQMSAEQRITDSPLKKCPKCGKMKLQRLISGGAGMMIRAGRDNRHAPACGLDSPCCGASSACADGGCDLQ